jgi:hypothetical protein
MNDDEGRISRQAIEGIVSPEPEREPDDNHIIVHLRKGFASYESGLPPCMKLTIRDYDMTVLGPGEPTGFDERGDEYVESTYDSDSVWRTKQEWAELGDAKGASDVYGTDGVS